MFLAFPESVEVEAWGRPTFRAGKKIFGVFAGTDEHPWGLIFKPDSDERAPLLEDERFYSPPYFGPSGWLALDLEAAPVDWDEVREARGCLVPPGRPEADAQRPGGLSRNRHSAMRRWRPPRNGPAP